MHQFNCISAYFEAKYRVVIIVIIPLFTRFVLLKEYFAEKNHSWTEKDDTYHNSTSFMILSQVKPIGVVT